MKNRYLLPLMALLALNLAAPGKMVAGESLENLIKQARQPFNLPLYDKETLPSLTKIEKETQTTLGNALIAFNFGTQESHASAIKTIQDHRCGLQSLLDQAAKLTPKAQKIEQESCDDWMRNQYSSLVAVKNRDDHKLSAITQATGPLKTTLESPEFMKCARAKCWYDALSRTIPWYIKPSVARLQAIENELIKREPCNQ